MTPSIRIVMMALPQPHKVHPVILSVALRYARESQARCDVLGGIKHTSMSESLCSRKTIDGQHEVPAA